VYKISNSNQTRKSSGEGSVARLREALRHETEKKNWKKAWDIGPPVGDKRKNDKTFSEKKRKGE